MWQGECPLVPRDRACTLGTQSLVKGGLGAALRLANGTEQLTECRGLVQATGTRAWYRVWG